MRITNEQIVELLLSTQTPDVLNHKRLAPNYLGSFFIDKFRISIVPDQDWSHYGRKVYDWNIRVEICIPPYGPFADPTHINYGNSYVGLSTRPFTSKFNSQRNVTRILRAIRKALKYRPMKLSNGRECIDFKGRHELIFID